MKPLAALLLLAIPFGLTSALAALLGLLIWPMYGRVAWVKNVYRAMDCLGAAVIGLGDGRYTVSAELGARPDCKVCSLVCRFLDLFDKGHCEGSAKNEKRIGG